MMKTPSSRPAKTPAGRKAVRSKKQPLSKKPSLSKKPVRAKITSEPPQNLIVDADDSAAIDSIAKMTATSLASSRTVNRRSAVDRLDDPPPADSQSSLVERVSNAIERELSKIETIIGVARVAPVLRTEAESRARVLASLARTLKEIMRLREQERAADAEMKAADDAIPRDLGELRSELARRLEILVGEATRLHPGATE
ncbi:MAG: hypothetical protein J0I29_12695 [Rhizobiales bacterium]|nr:hypothetical protein [Hyphomicrobiales bacterium]